MMDERRIRHLHIRSPKTALLQPARHQVEEAFRLCSLPALPPHAQLLIRRLELGAIRVDQSASQLAERVNQLVRDQLAGAVCVDQRSAPTAEAVWFSDPLQPLRVLLQRLLDGKAANEWYWAPLLRPSRLAPAALQSPPLSCTSPSIGLLLTTAAQLPLRGLAIARLLEASLAPARWQRLCAGITTSLARGLLSVQGVVIREGDERGEPQQEAIAAPALDHAWQQALRLASDCWGAGDIRSQWVAWNALLSTQPAWLERRIPVARIAPQAWLHNWGLAPPVAPRRQTVGAGQGRVAAAVAATRAIGTAIDKTIGTEVPGASAAQVTSRQDETNTAASLPQHQQGPGRSGQEAKVLATSNPALSIATPSAPVASNTTAVLSLASPQAGFALLIPLLQRLDLAALLAANESLLAQDLPRHLLRAMAERFHLAENDPLHQLWPEGQPLAITPLEFIKIPPTWRQWTTISGWPLRRFDPTNPSFDLRQLLNLLQSLAALWLRRHCRLSLRSLINRPGRVILTATHWDVIFDLNQVDLRLRRVALDVDPGWVPWLGRVVQFHYRAAGDDHVGNF